MCRPRITVCVLLFGDYPELAERCLRSIADTIPVADMDLRIGLNSVSARVRDWVYAWAGSAIIIRSDQNIRKYPMMRRLFYDFPIRTDRVMWFDDDSAIQPAGDPGWLDRVLAAAADATVMGGVYTQPWFGQQRGWVQRQPWYTGLPTTRSPRVKFVTGGWWVADTKFLRKWDYPWPSLLHNGGDALLGELVAQQHGRLVPFRDSVWINADEHGKESRAKRRGVTEPYHGAGG